MRIQTASFLVLVTLMTSHPISGEPATLKNLDQVIKKAVKEAIEEYCPTPVEEAAKSGHPSRVHADCPAGFTACAGRCYSALEVQLNHTAAERRCGALGARLPVPLSRAENLCVAGVSEGRRVWLGVTDRAREGQFVGTDGTPAAETEGRWADGQPDDFTGVDPEGEDCVEMSDHWRLADWNDESCRTELRVVCELGTEQL